MPNLSMEYAVLEHTGHNYVQRCRFGWADVGTWNTMATDVLHSPRTNTPNPPSDVKVDGRENITMHSEALFDNASGNIVRLPSGHIAAIFADGKFMREMTVITEADGVLMICPKDDAAAMRRLQTLAHLENT